MTVVSDMVSWAFRFVTFLTYYLKYMPKEQHAFVSIGQINIDNDKALQQPDLHDLPVLPTRNLVLFPQVTIPINLGRKSSLELARQAQDKSMPIGVVCQKDPDVDNPSVDDLYPYGVVADVLKVLDLPDGSHTAIVKAREKFRILGRGSGSSDWGALTVAAKPVRETQPRSGEDKDAYDVLGVQILDKARQVVEAAGSDLRVDFLFNASDNTQPRLIINTLATQMPFSPEDKESMLTQCRMFERGLKLLGLLMRDEHRIEVSKNVAERARQSVEQNQRNAILQQQLEAIRTELYGEPDDEIDELESRAAQVNFPDDVRSVVAKEIEKLRHYNPQSPDYSVQFNYIDTLLSLPWGVYSDLNNDFAKAQQILEDDHYGLEKVKERILEQLALIMDNPDNHATIICLVGPPGVGKTSIGKSIAHALGREYARVSLGGLHDEAEIRGHRRTYIGAMPGRIMDAVKRAKSSNPVILLDELDKIGADFKGDPAAALLEVLDPAQNCKFHDNYVDVDFDLSQVLFIATANSLSTISRPLLDRIEVIELSGYLVEEKVEIARRHLLPRLVMDYPAAADLKISDEALTAIIERYTSESGVRALEKKLSAIVRKRVLAAKRSVDFPSPVRVDDLHELLGTEPFIRERYEGNEFPGVVTGLAWTEVGGTILLVEVALSPGKGDSISLTGNLGNVMKESASIAMQWVKAHGEALGIDCQLFTTRNVHIHFPEGAVPKDGPSAGITMATAITSAFTGRRVRERIAMTGEITLRGKVLPVGGIKEKILAAKRAGITDIVLCSDNRKDIDDIDKRYISGLNFHYVTTVDEVLDYALLP